jgi:hypothetical protein
MKLRLILLALATSLALRAADTLPIFNATLAMGHDTRFLLVNPAGKTSPWLKVGDNFEGYKLKAYDAKATALDLEHDGKVTRITLVSDASVANAAAGTAAASTPATLADATALMNKIHIDQLVERTIAMQRKAIAASVDRIGTNFPNADPVDVAALQKKIMDMVNGTLDPSLMKADLTKAYSETFSKDELDQISAFYDTPLGQVLLAKQPEVQQKIQDAMIPRMQQIGPNIQQMARDFAMDQKAKMSAASSSPAPAPAPKP